jgi:predicted phage terminase large subunit-like protein
MLNLPPRHLKTYTLINAVTWWLGHNPNKQVISISYNDTLAQRFSKAIRDKIDTESADYQRTLYFQDIFTERLKHGDKASKVWALEGSHHTYLGGSLNSTVTGMGCQLGIIDDPIKNDYEALNDAFLEDLFFHYNNTFLSRIEEGGKQIINMTRWSKNDLCGKLLEVEAEDWYILKMRAVQDYESEKMLCPDILSFESFIDKTKAGKMSDMIVAANYQQAPIALKGLLYNKFPVYEQLPDGIVRAYVDTADEGMDYLCAIVYVEINEEAFVIDVIYTQDRQEDTEKKLAHLLEINGVNECMFESNNGGKSYARFVAQHLETNYCTIKWVPQTENKAARLLSYSPWISEHVYWPKMWSNRWPEFFNHLRTFKKKVKDNKHDDCADALTGVAEMISNPDKFRKATAVSGLVNEVVIL